MRQTNE